MNVAINKMITDIIDNLSTGDLQTALDNCRVALDQDPKCAPVTHLMGVVAHRMGDQGLAINLVERAHNIEPDYRDYPALLSYLCAMVGRLRDSLYYAKLAVALPPHPDFSNLLPNDLPADGKVFGHIGLSLHGLIAETAFVSGNYEEAIHQAELELRLNPTDLDSMLLMTRALLANGQMEAALAQLRAAVHLHSTSAQVHRCMGEVLTSLGEHDLAMASQDLALELAPKDERIAADIIAQRAWQTDANSAARADSTAEIERRMSSGRKPRAMSEHRGMHLGIVWDQCVAGPAMDFVLPVLESLENVILYRLNRRSDRMTEMARTAVMRFQDLQNVDPATLDRIISGDRPYGLINLCGGGEESAYPLFSGPGAPVTLSWLNQPLPNHLPATDYIISADATSDLDQAQFTSDQIIPMPQLLAWRFPSTGDTTEIVGALPRDRNGYVTFGAITDMRRITAQTIALWARVLWAVPESVLLIGGVGMPQRAVMDKILGCFANLGVINRIKFHRAVDDVRPLLDLMARIDVLLDSAPVSGLSETAEALWMGVPVVTMRSSRRAGRGGVAILDAAGRPEWAANDPEDFACVALDIAHSTDLAAIRSGLRDSVANSPLCDVQSFAQALEAAIKAKAFN